ncbi:hypothetical protein ACJRO7_033634 [Eucalyptus globulus]|uniref:Uncharacterized protein n=1 Tax=Eucalyptus globulus TaxID=34317 RepID=A0ABD3JQ03_EUCGL
MKLTCLSRGRGFYFPQCHMLSVCGFRILIYCPLDLSPLTAFAPIPPGFSAVQDEEDFGHSVDKSDGCESGNEEREDTENPMNAKALICSEPWYKTVASLHLWNLSFIDVVLISSPTRMLGLPFLTRAKGFSAKEFRQLYGSEDFTSPYRMKWEELESLPPALKEIVLGTNGIEIGGWMPLYRYPNGMIRFISSFEFVPGHTLDDLEELLLHAGENSEEMDNLNFICSCAVDAVKAGEFVLIPIGQLGIILQLWEQISICLENHIIMYSIGLHLKFILCQQSFLILGVCKQRQEKLFFGEPFVMSCRVFVLFRLHVYSVIYSHELSIVFCRPHWSLRLGPPVHLLRRWHGDEKSLLTWGDKALLPFDHPMEMKMKVLLCSFLSGIVQIEGQTVAPHHPYEFIPPLHHSLQFATMKPLNSMTTLDYRENLEDSNTDTWYQNDKKISLVLVDENFPI